MLIVAQRGDIVMPNRAGHLVVLHTNRQDSSFAVPQKVKSITVPGHVSFRAAHSPRHVSFRAAHSPRHVSFRVAHRPRHVSFRAAHSPRHVSFRAAHSPRHVSFRAAHSPRHVSFQAAHSPRHVSFRAKPRNLLFSFHFRYAAGTTVSTELSSLHHQEFPQLTAWQEPRPPPVPLPSAKKLYPPAGLLSLQNGNTGSVFNIMAGCDGLLLWCISGSFGSR